MKRTQFGASKKGLESVKVKPKKDSFVIRIEDAKSTSQEVKPTGSMRKKKPITSVVSNLPQKSNDSVKPPWRLFTKPVDSTPFRKDSKVRSLWKTPRHRPSQVSPSKRENQNVTQSKLSQKSNSFTHQADCKLNASALELTPSKLMKSTSSNGALAKTQNLQNLQLPKVEPPKVQSPKVQSPKVQVQNLKILSTVDLQIQNESQNEGQNQNESECESEDEPKTFEEIMAEVFKELDLTDDEDESVYFFDEKDKERFAKRMQRQMMLKVTREDVKTVLEKMNDSGNVEEVRKDRIDLEYRESLARISEMDKEVDYVKCFFANRNA